MWSIIFPLVGVLIGGLARHFGYENTWGQVRRVAVAILKDPEKTDDPREAITQAMWEVQLARLAAEADKVKAAFVVNGSNPYPKR